MYFKNFSLEDVITDSGKIFIKELSDLLEFLEPPLVDKKRLEISCTTDNDGEFIKVYIPHNQRRIFDVTIDFDEAESIVHLANACFHFQEYSEEKQRIDDTINLIAKIMQNTMEIHTFYKGNKIIKIKPYFINKNGEKELFQCSFYNLILFLNPFVKVQEEVETGSFSY